MKTIAAALLAAIAALAAAGFAWQKSAALVQAKAELANANEQVQKAKGDVLAMKADTLALGKELLEQKRASERAQADLAAAQSYLDAEKAAGARLREELVKTREQLAAAGRPRSAPGPASAPGVVRVAPLQQPMVIKAAPGGSAAVQAAPSGPPTANPSGVGAGTGYGGPAR